MELLQEVLAHLEDVVEFAARFSGGGGGRRQLEDCAFGQLHDDAADVAPQVGLKNCLDLLGKIWTSVYAMRLNNVLGPRG